MTYSRLMKLDTQNRRKTLGTFIREMRNRASFHDDIQMVLERFLESRNCLIHRFDEIPGSNLETDYDRQTLEHFLAQLAADTEILMAFCQALIKKWANEIELPESLSIQLQFVDQSDEFKDKVLSMVQYMDSLVFAKKTDTNDAI